MYKAKAYSAATAASPLARTSIPRRDPTEHDVQIEMLYCGICHLGMSFGYGPAGDKREMTSVIRSAVERAWSACRSWWIVEKSSKRSGLLIRRGLVAKELTWRPL